MIHKNVARTVFLYAWTPADGNPKTDDADNITVYKAEDTGDATEVTDAIAEIDSDNMPGWYRLTHTFGGDSAAIAAKSSTSGVLVTIGGIYLNTGAIPSAAAGSNGGLPTVNTNNHVAGVASAVNITSDGQTIDQTKIANLDATVSSRLATASYVAPDNTKIGEIKAKTDKLQFSDDNDVKATLDGEPVKVEGQVQTLDALNTKLVTEHGATSWTTATGFAVPGSAMALTTEAVDAIETKLKTVHGEGSWTTATGFAVAGDKMDLKPEAVDAIETKLKTVHGEGSWTTATGFAVPGSAMTLTTEAVDAIDTKLKSAHGEGSWTTATGFAVAGDAMDLKTEAVEAIETKLKTAHGEGSWTTATGFAKPGDEMALSSQTVQAIAAAVPDPMKAVVPGTYGTGTAGEAIGKIKEQTDKAQFDAQNRILATAEVEVAGIELTDEMIDAIWNRPRGEGRPEGSFGDYLDQKVSEVSGGGGGGVIVQPIEGTVMKPAGNGGDLELFETDKVRITWALNADLRGHNLYLLFFEEWAKSATRTIPPANITITAQEEGCLVVVDADDQYMPPAGVYRWVLKDQTLDCVVLAGKAIVRPIPDIEEGEE